MFKDEASLKQFITWAKDMKLKRFKNGDIEFEISDLGLVEELNRSALSGEKEITDFENKTLVDTEELSQQEQDDLLFWSTNK